MFVAPLTTSGEEMLAFFFFPMRVFSLPLLILLSGLCPSGVVARTHFTPLKPLRPVVRVLERTHDAPKRGSWLELQVVVGQGALSTGETLRVFYPGWRSGRHVTRPYGMPFPRVGELLQVALNPAPFGYVVGGIYREPPASLHKDSPPFTMREPPVVAVNERGIPLFWSVRGIYLSPSEECGATLLEVLGEEVALWTRETPTGTALELLLDPPGTVRVGFNDDGVNHNVILCETSWSYGPHTHGITLLTTVDAPGAQNDGEIVDADILINFQNLEDLTADGTRLRTIVGHELGHLLGFEHPCNLPADYIAKDLPDCALLEDESPARRSLLFPLSDSGVVEPSAEDLEGVSLLFPPGDERPVARVDTSTEGCGCVAGGRAPSSGLFPWVVLLFLLGLRAREAAKGNTH